MEAMTPPTFPLRPFLEEMEYGAERPVNLIKRLGEKSYGHLIGERYLKVIPVQRVGELAILGARGREALGKSPSGKTTPESALGQFYRRRLRERLEVDGWRFTGYAREEYRPDPMPIFVFGNAHLYTLCKGSEYSTQTVKRVLLNFEWQLREKGRLLLVTEEPDRFKQLCARPRWANLLETTTLKLV